MSVFFSNAREGNQNSPKNEFQTGRISSYFKQALFEFACLLLSTCFYQLQITDLTNYKSTSPR